MIFLSNDVKMIEELTKIRELLTPQTRPAKTKEFSGGIQSIFGKIQSFRLGSGFYNGDIYWTSHPNNCG